MTSGKRNPKPLQCSGRRRVGPNADALRWYLRHLTFGAPEALKRQTDYGRTIYEFVDAPSFVPAWRTGSITPQQQFQLSDANQRSQEGALSSSAVGLHVMGSGGILAIVHLIVTFLGACLGRPWPF